MGHKNIITQYIRDNNSQPTAILVATIIDKELKIGWSAQNINKEKQFNRKRCREIALRRLQDGTTAKMPHIVRQCLTRFEERAKRHFKIYDDI